MKPVIKLNNYDLDIVIANKFAKDIRIGDILCVYDFDNEKKAKWVIDFIGDDYDDAPYDIFPVDPEYREENSYFKLKVTDREFRDDELIIWADIWSNVGEVEFP